MFQTLQRTFTGFTSFSSHENTGFITTDDRKFEAFADAMLSEENQLKLFEQIRERLNTKSPKASASGIRNEVIVSTLKKQTQMVLNESNIYLRHLPQSMRSFQTKVLVLDELIVSSSIKEILSQRMIYLSNRRDVDMDKLRNPYNRSIYASFPVYSNPDPVLGVRHVHNNSATINNSVNAHQFGLSS